jgi:hypothetical protein
MAGGRPTKYKRAFCAKVISLGKLGKSKAQMAAALGVTRKTMDSWVDDHPEFLSAMEQARDLALCWWENQGQSGVWEKRGGRKFNASLWSRSMAARFPAEYRESSKLEVEGRLTLEDLVRASLTPAAENGAPK